MNQQPTYLVSVIISFLNEQYFLREALDSVFHQDYGNWELILIDDGSTDDSTIIAKDFAAKNPGKVIYTEHPHHGNMGLSASRNHGISLARGELIAILDADDVWSPAKLGQQVDLIKAYPEVGMICEASEYWYSWNKKYNSSKDEIIQVGKQQDKVFSPPQLVEILYPLSDGAAPCPSGIIVRKTVFDRHLGFEAHFTGKYQMYEDQAFLFKIYLNEFVYISSLCNNRYRQREGSLVQKVTQEGDYAVVRKYFLKWLKLYMRQNNIRNQKIEWLIYKAYEPYNRPVIHFIRNLFNRVIKRIKK
ncbi:MAG: glycosyltransferase family 2 protein [Chitinophagaceae bacterium]